VVIDEWYSVNRLVTIPIRRAARARSCAERARLASRLVSSALAERALPVLRGEAADVGALQEAQQRRRAGALRLRRKERDEEALGALGDRHGDRAPATERQAERRRAV
jgi:hypothetical protein